MCGYAENDDNTSVLCAAERSKTIAKPIAWILISIFAPFIGAVGGSSTILQHQLGLGT
jgi:hypothetical protein